MEHISKVTLKKYVLTIKWESGLWTVQKWYNGHLVATTCYSTTLRLVGALNMLYGAYQIDKIGQFN